MVIRFEIISENAYQARIITLDKDASLKTDRGEVPAISFWKWALSKA